MRVQEHLKLSTAAAVVALPFLRQDTWIPYVASLGIDVDHYVWHAMTHRTLSLRQAMRYYGQADPPQIPQQRLLHHPFVLGGLLFLAVRLRSRPLSLILGGLLFHVSLDVIHNTQMKRLKSTLSEQARGHCPQCGKPEPALQLHTVRVARNLLDRYNASHYVALCPTCHEEAHRQPANTTRPGRSAPLVNWS